MNSNDNGDWNYPSMYERLELYAFDEEMQYVGQDGKSVTQAEVNARDKHGCLFGALIIFIVIVAALRTMIA